MEQSLSDVSLTIVTLFPRAMIFHFYQDKLQGTSMYAMPAIILEALFTPKNPSTRLLSRHNGVDQAASARFDAALDLKLAMQLPK